jgi:hypothetical protein
MRRGGIPGVLLMAGALSVVAVAQAPAPAFRHIDPSAEDAFLARLARVKWCPQAFPVGTRCRAA